MKPRPYLPKDAGEPKADGEPKAVPVPKAVRALPRGESSCRPLLGVPSPAGGLGRTQAAHELCVRFRGAPQYLSYEAPASGSLSPLDVAERGSRVLSWPSASKALWVLQHREQMLS